MENIRIGCFETNSSSVHSICMCSKNEYDKWAKDWNNVTRDSYILSGESLIPIVDVVNDWNDMCKRYGEDKNIITIDSIINKNDEKHNVAVEYLREDGNYTEDDFFSSRYDYDTYCEEYVTPGGETVIAFGEYGYNG